MSQLGADDWILSMFPNDYEGFFLDVGCGDGEFISNTFSLEQKGWRGICIDAFPRNMEKRTKSTVISGIVYSEKDVEVEFVVPENQDLSAIRQCLGCHAKLVKDTTLSKHTFKTMLLQDVLDANECPATIDYMNLDIEGAEYEVLRVFPFDRYTIKYLSVEHNWEYPKTDQIHNVLVNNNFELLKEVKWDRWYVHKTMLPCM